MAKEAATADGRGGMNWRIAGWGTAAALVLLPLLAMQFTREVNWTFSDFLFAAVLIGGVGGALELTMRLTRNIAYRAAIAAALAAAFLIIWANAAVGMIGSEDNPFNLLFGGVIALALAGAAAARFRAAGMARAMLVAAIAQAAVGIAGTSSDPRGGVLSAAFAGLWLLSAALFRKAAHQPAGAGAR